MVTCECPDPKPYQPIAGPLRCGKCFKETVVDYVCKRDGVLIGTNKALRLVHLDELPAGVGDHEIEIISASTYEAWAAKQRSVREAALDMLVHHKTLCSLAECGWEARLSSALRGPAA